MVAQHPRFSPMRSFVACAALSLPLWCFGTANALAGEAVVNEHLGEEEAVAVEVLMQSNGVQTIEEETLAFSASEETPVFQSSQTDAMATTVGSSPIEGSLEDPPHRIRHT